MSEGASGGSWRTMYVCRAKLMHAYAGASKLYRGFEATARGLSARGLGPFRIRLWYR